MNADISSNLEQSIQAKRAFVEESLGQILQFVEWTVETFEAGRKVLIFGNGGSAADAQHMAAEFVNRFKIDRRPLPAIALTTDSSILTSIGNDFGFDLVYVKQVQALGDAGDLVIAISTSGNSPNVVQAVAAAREKGIRTVALTGGMKGDGGELGKVADLVLNVPAETTAHIQEAHLWLEHMVCELAEKEIFG